jgi:hypothetical protein
MSELLALADPALSLLNPIGVLDAMSAGALDYCPLVYQYTAYPLSFTDAPSWPGEQPGSVLGGTGLAVSRRRIDGIRDAVRAHPTAAKFLRAGYAESSVTWTDEATGLACKGRLDFVSTAIPALVDLKSTHDLAGLGPAAARYGWNCQLAFYRAGLRAVGFDLPTRVLAVETRPPFAVRVLTLHDDDLWRGEREVAELLRKVADCTELGSWPAGGAEEEVLRLPTWGLRLAEQDDLTSMGLVPRKAV